MIASPAASTGRAFRLQRGEREPLDVAAADHPLAQPREPVRRDPGGG